MAESSRSDESSSPWLFRILPGVGLCAIIWLGSVGIGRFQLASLGRMWIDPIILAILIGMGVRLWQKPGDLLNPGIEFSAKRLLEMGVALLGAGVTMQIMSTIGAGFIVAIIGITLIALWLGYWIGRRCGLSQNLALLVAGGGAICGNSAIASIGSLLEAKRSDIAAAITFTTLIGLFWALAIPLVGQFLAVSQARIGAFAGLTAYAVPQVLAASGPAGPIAVQIGATVKLVRVMMLGPVSIGLSLFADRPERRNRNPSLPNQRRSRFNLIRYLPWFILLFAALATARLSGLIPLPAAEVMAVSSKHLILIAMAGFGLSTDLSALTENGGAVTKAAILSLLALAVVSVLGIALIGPT